MSVALVLFCVSAVAQNENQTRNTTDECFGVTVSTETVLLWAGEETSVFVTLLPGYNDPYLMFEGVRYEFGELIIGGFFTAELKFDEEGMYVIEIRTSKNLTEDYAAYIFVRASIDPDGMARNSIEFDGYPILISVFPRLGN